MGGYYVLDLRTASWVHQTNVPSALTQESLDSSSLLNELDAFDNSTYIACHACIYVLHVFNANNRGNFTARFRTIYAVYSKASGFMLMQSRLEGVQTIAGKFHARSFNGVQPISTLEEKISTSTRIKLMIFSKPSIFDPEISNTRGPPRSGAFESAWRACLGIREATTTTTVQQPVIRDSTGLPPIHRTRFGSAREISTESHLVMKAMSSSEEGSRSSGIKIKPYSKGGGVTMLLPQREDIQEQLKFSELKLGSLSDLDAAGRKPHFVDSVTMKKVVEVVDPDETFKLTLFDVSEDKEMLGKMVGIMGDTSFRVKGDEFKTFRFEDDDSTSSGGGRGTGNSADADSIDEDLSVRIQVDLDYLSITCILNSTKAAVEVETVNNDNGVLDEEKGEDSDDSDLETSSTPNADSNAAPPPIESREGLPLFLELKMKLSTSKLGSLYEAGSDLGLEFNRGTFFRPSPPDAPPLECKHLKGLNHILVIPSSDSKNQYFEVTLSKKRRWTVNEKNNLFRCYLVAVAVIWEKTSEDYYQAIFPRYTEAVNSNDTTSLAVSLGPSEKIESAQGIKVSLMAVELFCLFGCTEKCAFNINNFGQKREVSTGIQISLKDGAPPLTDASFRSIQGNIEKDAEKLSIYNLIKKLGEHFGTEKSTTHFGIGVTAQMLWKDEKLCCFLGNKVIDGLVEEGPEKWFHAGADGVLPDPAAVVSSMYKDAKLTVYSKVGLPPPMCSWVQSYVPPTSGFGKVRSQSYQPSLRHFDGKRLDGGSARKDVEDATRYIAMDSNGRPILRIGMFEEKIAIYKRLVKDLVNFMSTSGISVRLEEWYVGGRGGGSSGFIPLEAIKSTVNSLLSSIRGYDRAVVSRYVGLGASTRFVLIERSLERLQLESTNFEAFQLVCQISQDCAWMGRFTTGRGAAVSGKLYLPSLAWLSGRPTMILSPLAPYVLSHALTISETDYKNLEALLADADEKKVFGKTLDVLRTEMTSARHDERRSKKIGRAQLMVCSHCGMCFIPPNQSFTKMPVTKQMKRADSPYALGQLHIQANPSHSGCLVKGDSPILTKFEAAAAEKLNPMQRMYIHNVVELGNNQYLGGKAGTGKSHVTVLAGTEIQKRYGMNSVVYLATTGIAASVLRSNPEGRTLHSFLGLPATEDFFDPKSRSPEKVEYYAKLLRENPTFADIVALFYDESSMASGEVFNFFDKICQCARRNSLPFGGIQLIASGDMMQLPIIQPKGGNRVLQFVFQSTSFIRAFPANLQSRINLLQVMRQDDPEFVAYLSRQRLAQCTQADLEYTKTFGKDIPRDAHIHGFHFPNRTVDRENVESLKTFPGTEEKYLPTIESGAMTSEGRAHWNKEARNLMKVLSIKVGADVLFIRNDIVLGYCNGMRGVYKGIEGSKLLVECESKSFEVAEFVFILKFGSTTLGSISRYPLRLDFHKTMHKGQGTEIGQQIPWGVNFGGTFGVLYGKQIRVPAGGYVGSTRGRSKEYLKYWCYVIDKDTGDRVHSALTLEALNNCCPISKAWELGEIERQERQLQELKSGTQPPLHDFSGTVAFALYLGFKHSCVRTAMTELMVVRKPESRGFFSPMIKDAADEMVVDNDEESDDDRADDGDFSSGNSRLHVSREEDPKKRRVTVADTSQGSSFANFSESSTIFPGGFATATPFDADESSIDDSDEEDEGLKGLSSAFLDADVSNAAQSFSAGSYANASKPKVSNIEFSSGGTRNPYYKKN
jgi:ATP-dependent DNA helicase PIF1